MSDMIAGVFEYEVVHGTVRQHYYRRKKDKKMVSPALIFAWIDALAKRGEIDNTSSLLSLPKSWKARRSKPLKRAK